MYVCGICQAHVGPRLPCLKHVLYWERVVGSGKFATNQKQIAREIPVCKECKEELAVLPYGTVLRRRGQRDSKHVRTALVVQSSSKQPVLLGEEI